jgi:hypothetical protein
MRKYTIGITTFSLRYDLLVELVKQVRKFSDNDIIIAINGDNKQEFNDDYRKKILKLCGSYIRIYPIFFTEFRGLTKMWNTITIHSCNEIILMLNDDVTFTTDKVFRTLDGIEDSQLNGIRPINSSFSHFVFTKTVLHNLKYFDERFLGFGHEDGDIMYRHVETYNSLTDPLWIDGIKNNSSDIGDKNVLRGADNRAASISERYCFKDIGPKYIPVSNAKIFSSFGNREKVIEDIQQYPHESFFKKHKDEI